MYMPAGAVAAPHDAGADHAHAGEHAAGADHGTAATHTPSSRVIGWQKKRNSGSFQSWLPVNR